MRLSKFAKCAVQLYISLNHTEVSMLLILSNYLLSCLQQCLKGLGIFTVHGFDYGIVVILAHFAWCGFISQL